MASPGLGQAGGLAELSHEHDASAELHDEHEEHEHIELLPQRRQGSTGAQTVQSAGITEGVVLPSQHAAAGTEVRPGATRPPPTRAETIMGMGLTLSSTFAFSAMALFVSLMGPFPSFETASIRFVLQASFTVLTILFARRGALGKSVTWFGKPQNRRLLVTRALWGACGMCSYFYALGHIRLSDASALVFTNVPLTAALACIILKEPYTWVDGFTSILCMLGVVLVAQPAAIFGVGDASASATALPWFAVAVCLFGACSSAMAYVTIRQLGPNEDTLVVVLYFGVIGSIVSPIVGSTLQTFQPAPSAKDAWLLVGTGITGFLGQLLLNRGMQMAPAGPATVMRYTDVVFAIAFQSTLLGDPPGALKLVGCALIMSCVAGVLYKHRLKRAAVTPPTPPAVSVSATASSLSAAASGASAALGASTASDDDVRVKIAGGGLRAT